MMVQPQVQRERRIFLSPPHMGCMEEEFVREAFESNYIAPLGPMVDAFEREFCEQVGIPHGVAVSSGTAACHLALRLLGVGPGDLVIASTLTFIGSVTPILFQGATPVFIDADKSSWTMDPGLLEETLRDLDRAGLRPMDDGDGDVARGGRRQPCGIFSTRWSTPWLIMPMA